MRTIAVICFLAAAVLGACALDTKKLGQRLAFCKRNKNDFESCLADRLQVVIPEIANNGIPEVKIPRGEPVVIPEMLVQYRNGNLSMDSVVRDSKTWGTSGVKIRGVRADINDPKHFHLEVDFTMPTIYIEGDYKMEGHILVPMSTKGYYNISMTDVTGTWDLTGEHFQKNGVDYVRITHFSMLPEVGDMKVYASNLFPGNEELSKFAIDFCNQYWKYIYKELLPVTDDAWAVLFRNELNKLFTKVPFSELFPEA